MTRAAFVKLKQDEAVYPLTPPYEPDRAYPEFADAGWPIGVDPSNTVYSGVRQLLIDLGLDSARRGTACWNPLSDYVCAGETVVIKPNLVIHKHFSGAEGLRWTITHPSVVRALIDYSLLAVGPSGQVVIADTPLEDCDFQELLRSSGYGEMTRALQGRGLNIEIRDLRSYQSLNLMDGKSERLPLPGDPQGYTDCDLAEASAFSELERSATPRNYYTMGDHSVDHLDISTRKPGKPTENHLPGRHIYRVSNSILNAAFCINVAKMKTHKFSGVTLCLKNAIGICNGKEFMPHRRPGPPCEGGDSYASPPSWSYRWRVRRARALSSFVGLRAASFLIEAIRRVFPRPLPHQAPWEPVFGDWSGNDTIWRTTVDLNRIWLGNNWKNRQSPSGVRKMLCVIDGVIGMDHEGPMAGMPVGSSVLVMAKDPVAADTLGAMLMGFDPEKIPTIKNAERLHEINLGLPLPHDSIRGNTSLKEAQTRFTPNRGWIEALGRDSEKNAPFSREEEVCPCESA